MPLLVGDAGHPTMPSQHVGSSLSSAGDITLPAKPVHGQDQGFLILELVQDHSLLMALDINHIIACKTGVRPSALPWHVTTGLVTGWGHVQGAHTCIVDPPQSHSKARLSSGEIGVGTWGSHCHLEVPGQHRLAWA